MASELAAIRVMVLASDGDVRAETMRLAVKAGLTGPLAPVLPGDRPGEVALARRLNLVIVAPGTGFDPRLVAWVTRLRADRDANVALAPVIALVPGVTMRLLQLLIASGFDDVVASPASPPDFARRVRASIVRPHDFFRTATYFGPDRRRLVDENPPVERRGAAPTFAFRVSIARDPLAGCRIVSQVPIRPAGTEAKRAETAAAAAP